MRQYTLKNPTVEKVSRSIGGAAHMSPTGVVGLMCTLHIPGDEVAELNLECTRVGDREYFVDIITTGEIVDGRLACALPLVDGGYLAAFVRIEAIRGFVTVSGGMPGDFTGQRFEGAVRRMLRQFVRQERGVERRAA